MAIKAAGFGIRSKSMAEMISADLPDCETIQTNVLGVTSPGVWWISSAVSTQRAGSPAWARVNQTG